MRRITPNKSDRDILTRPTAHAHHRLRTSFSRFIDHRIGIVWKVLRESQTQGPRQQAALDRIRSQATDLPNSTTVGGVPPFVAAITREVRKLYIVMRQCRIPSDLRQKTKTYLLQAAVLKVAVADLQNRSYGAS